MKKCANCSHEGEDELTVCPHCGTPYATDAMTEESEPVKDETVEKDVTATETKKEVKAETVKSADDSLLSKAGKFGLNVTACEKKNHFILNGIILAFSLIMFICSFFSGARVVYSIDGLDIPFKQTVFDLIGGAFAYAETDETEMKNYIRESGSKINNATQEAATKYAAELATAMASKDMDEINAVMQKIGDEVGKNADVNFLKLKIFTAKLELETGGETNSMDAVATFIGSGVGAGTLAMLIAGIITPFVFMIMSLIALIKRKEFKNPFKAALLPMAFMLAKMVTLSLNPIMIMDAIGNAMIAVSFIFAFLLCAYKYTVRDSVKSINVMGLIKNGALLVLGIVIFFVACGPMYQVESVNGLTIKFTGGKAVNFLLLRSVFGERMGFMLMYMWVFQIGTLSAAAPLMYAVWKRLYNGKGGKIIKNTVATLVFVILTLAGVITFGSLQETMELISKPELAANTIVTIIFTIGLLVFNGVMPSESKKKENSQNKAEIAE